MEELGLLDQPPKLFGCCQTQRYDGFEGVENCVGIGDLEFHIGDVHLLEVVEVIEDG
jgi:hypothetical protein